MVRRKIKKGRLVFKLGFEKAYDRVNWAFLNQLLVRKVFDDRCSWIRGCVSMLVFFVMVNGSLNLCSKV